MEVELTAEESSMLQKALQSYLSDLRMEIVDTDNRTYRQELRDERAALETVLEKLAVAAQETNQRDDAGRAVIRVVGVWVE